MFGSKGNKPQSRIDCLIGTGTTIEGNITFTGGLRVDGHVRGSVVAADGKSGTLVLSEQAHIEGEIRVSHVVINGTVNGPIAVNDQVELQAKARVAGDVSYRTLEMHVGAVVQGRLIHAEPGIASVVELKRQGSG
jgi:cytoskeletal protein CcmA (bactofilin family)